MSFDIPLFFRVLFGARRDLIVVEPPPTTGFFVRLAAAIRRTPYAYYAADIWSDAAAQTGVARWAVRTVQRIERLVLTDARIVLSVNEGVSRRISEIAPEARLSTVGNGADTKVFSPSERSGASPIGQYAIYCGTASEWQGAGIFIDAFQIVHEKNPDARLIFLGHGSDWPALQEKAQVLPPDTVRFIATVPPDIAAEWITSAATSLASIKPDSGYSFAFPTKVYSSWACGTPVVFAGEGAVPEFMGAQEPGIGLGEAPGYDVVTIADALLRMFASPRAQAERLTLASWAAENVSLDAVANRAVQSLTLVTDEGGAC